MRFMDYEETTVKDNVDEGSLIKEYLKVKTHIEINQVSKQVIINTIYLLASKGKVDECNDLIDRALSSGAKNNISKEIFDVIYDFIDSNKKDSSIAKFIGSSTFWTRCRLLVESLPEIPFEKRVNVLRYLVNNTTGVARPVFTAILQMLAELARIQGNALTCLDDIIIALISRINRDCVILDNANLPCQDLLGIILSAIYRKVDAFINKPVKAFEFYTLLQNTETLIISFAKHSTWVDVLRFSAKFSHNKRLNNLKVERANKGLQMLIESALNFQILNFLLVYHGLAYFQFFKCMPELSCADIFNFDNFSIILRTEATFQGKEATQFGLNLPSYPKVYDYQILIFHLYWIYNIMVRLRDSPMYFELSKTFFQPFNNLKKWVSFFGLQIAIFKVKGLEFDVFGEDHLNDNFSLCASLLKKNLITPPGSPIFIDAIYDVINDRKISESINQPPISLNSLCVFPFPDSCDKSYNFYFIKLSKIGLIHFLILEVMSRLVKNSASRQNLDAKCVGTFIILSQYNWPQFREPLENLCHRLRQFNISIQVPFKFLFDSNHIIYFWKLSTTLNLDILLTDGKENGCITRLSHLISNKPVQGCNVIDLLYRFLLENRTNIRLL